MPIRVLGRFVFGFSFLALFSLTVVADGPSGNRHSPLESGICKELLSQSK